MSRNGFVGALIVALAVACSSSGGNSGGSQDCNQLCQHISSLCPGQLSESDIQSCVNACNGATSSQRACLDSASSCNVAEDCVKGGGSGGSGATGGGSSTGGSSTGGNGGSGADCPVGTCTSIADGAKACLSSGSLPSGSEPCSYSNPCPTGKYCINNSSGSGCVWPCGGYVPKGCPAECQPYGSSVCCGGAFCSGDCIGNPCC